MKPLLPVELQLEGIKSNRWHVRVDARVNPASDVWKPQFWVNCPKLMPSDLVRIEAIDGSYDFCVKVIGEQFNNGKRALRVEPWPSLPEYVLAAYADASVMVPAVMNGKKVPRIDFTNGTLWRLIGMDGQTVEQGYRTEAAATAALERYMAAHGITEVADQPAVNLVTGEVAKDREPAAVDPLNDPNIAPNVRKKIAEKAAKDERVKRDLAALEARKAAKAAAET